MRKSPKKCAPTPDFVSQNQLVFEGFESPFEKKLNPENRWVVLAKLIPWDEICNIYLKAVPNQVTGRPGLSPRVVLGATIIKHLCDIDDRETVDQISENIYMQHFLGYSSFSDEPPFDPSLFVRFRKHLSMEVVNKITEKIIAIKTKLEEDKSPPKEDSDSFNDNGGANKGTVIMDATACPQDIAFPTDLNLLNDAREKSEMLIDILYIKELHGKKPRTYREKARTAYFETAQKKCKTIKIIRKGVGHQLRYLKRNIGHINDLLDKCNVVPLKGKDLKYLYVIQTLYLQQQEMFDAKTKKTDNRITSIHQPHVRPIVRGKSQAKVEFGAKIHCTMINGITFLDQLSWDAFNEGSHLMNYVEQYKNRFGCYPKRLLVDKIYSTRDNRAKLKEKGIELVGKPLGRPSLAVKIDLSPGERNPIEGKFGQAKTGYGLDRIKARLQDTSESWIASIFLVLNLVKLAGVALHCLIALILVSFSKCLMQEIGQNENRCDLNENHTYELCLL
ncbi:Transposase InsH, N-terminal [Flavobacteriaceae bacterium]